MRTLSSILALAFLAHALPASAQEDEIVPLRRGERAPFEGQLFSTETAFLWGNRLERFRLINEQLRLQHQEELQVVRDNYEGRIEVLTASYDGELRELRVDLREQVIALSEELEKERNKPWYKTWGFGFGLGLVVSSVVLGLTIGLVN